MRAEPEDHIAALFDVMRHLLQSSNATLEEQRAFFERWIQPALEPLCSAIERSEELVFYKPVARFASAFCDLEQDRLRMML